VALLKNLNALAQALRAERLARGAIELAMTENKIIFDEQGNAVGAAPVENDFSHQLVEEFMLVANVCVAEWAKKNNLPVLHRLHETPAPEAIEELTEFLTASGYPFRLPFKRANLQKVLTKAHGKPEEHSINLAVLRSFARAVYAPEATVGHFALNFSSYLHFTSPIRRYPDLQLHQMLDQAFGTKAKLPAKLTRKILAPELDLHLLGQQCSDRERRAMKVENGIKDFWRLQILSNTSEREFTAVVTGIRKFALFVEIEKYLVEGRLEKWQIERRGFFLKEVNPNTHGAASKGFHLGQEVRVRVSEINLAARECKMEFIGLARKSR
jgi:ribonuclease R